MDFTLPQLDFLTAEGADGVVPVFKSGQLGGFGHGSVLPQWAGQVPRMPLLNRSSVSVSADVTLGSRKSQPDGGTFKLPISASAAAMAAFASGQFAPVATFSLAAIS